MPTNYNTSSNYHKNPSKKTYRRKQTRQHRLDRLANFCCPVHGIGMTQANIIYDKCLHCESYIPIKCVVKCTRRDCEIYGYQDTNGNLAIAPELEYLLNGE